MASQTPAELPTPTATTTNPTGPDPAAANTTKTKSGECSGPVEQIYREQEALEKTEDPGKLLDELSGDEEALPDAALPGEIILDSSMEECDFTDRRPPEIIAAQQKVIDDYTDMLKRRHKMPPYDETDTDSDKGTGTVSNSEQAGSGTGGATVTDSNPVTDYAVGTDSNSKQAGSGSTDHIKKTPGNGNQAGQLSNRDQAGQYKDKGNGNKAGSPVERSISNAAGPTQADSNTEEAVIPDGGVKNKPKQRAEQLPGVYLAIKKRNKQDTLCPNLNGAYPMEVPAAGSFFQAHDTRENLAIVTFDLASNTNTSFSFDSNKMACLCCGTFLSKKSERGGEKKRLAIVLSDQNFPAALPAAGERGGCLKIIRVESGSLAQLADVFNETFSGWLLPQGSIVMMQSISHLSNVGLEAYVADLFHARDSINGGNHGHIAVTIAPYVILGGIADPLTVRALAGFCAWAESDKTTWMPTQAIGISLHGISDCGTGGHQQPYSRRVRLATSLADLRDKVWLDGGLTNLPNGVKAYPEELEENIVFHLTEELNTALALDLDPTPSTERLVEKPAPPNEDPTFVMVGCSHSSKTAAALRKNGARTIEVTETGWRTTSARIAALAAKLSDALKIQKEVSNLCIIIQLFDTCFYFTRAEDGTLNKGTRDSEGRFHVEGESVLIDKEGQYRAYKLLLPLLDACKPHNTILLAPLPRYYENSCCSNVHHVTNAAEPSYKKQLEDSVYSCKDNLRDFTFRHGYRNARVMNPWHTIKKFENVWNPDAVHLHHRGYDAIGGAIKAAARDLFVKKRNASSSAAGQPPDKRSRRDDTATLPERSGTNAAEGNFNRQQNYPVSRMYEQPRQQDWYGTRRNQHSEERWDTNYQPLGARGNFRRGAPHTRGSQPPPGGYERGGQRRWRDRF